MSAAGHWPTDRLAAPLVAVHGLRIEARQPGGDYLTIADDVAFSIGRGEVLALVGEAGAGKTTIGLALLGHARPGCRIAAGHVQLDDTAVLSLDAEGLCRLRGHRVAYVAPHAASAFDPSMRIVDQVIERVVQTGMMAPAAAVAKAMTLFDALGLADPARVGQRYPHQLSGGEPQRLMAAMALMTDPQLLVLDAPTDELDPTLQREVLAALQQVLRRLGSTAIVLTRHLTVAAHLADRIGLLREGRLGDCHPTNQVLQAPEAASAGVVHASALPCISDDAPAAPLLELRNLTAGYGARDSRGRPAIRVLDGIDLVVRRAGAVGVIGESGSGKTTLARVVAGMVAATPGSVLRFRGEPLPATVVDRTAEQRRRIQIVFQHADAALNPRHRVEDVVARPLAVFHGVRGAASRQRVLQLVDLVELPAALAGCRGADLSSEQVQRASLARALAAEPDVIICDDLTTSLDPAAAARILALLARLRQALGVSYLFVGHDIAAAGAVCDDLVVLHGGRAVETGEQAALREPPFHPYTFQLISSLPPARAGRLDALPPAAPLPAVGPSSGADLICPYLRRCPVRIDGRCNHVAPPRRRLPGKDVFCHREPAELLRWQAPPPSG